MYLKCYGGPQCLEEWLVENLYPLIRRWRGEQVFRLFHFVRYMDPDYHLRIRFLITKPDCLATIVDEINRSMSQLAESERIWKMELCTYRPEIGRYGADRMPLVEEIFDHDSEFWLSVLHQMGVEASTHIWKVAILSVHRLLDAFGADTSCRRDLLEGMRVSFAAEFGLNRSLKVQLDAKYRNDLPVIEQLMRQGFKQVEEALSLRGRSLAEPVGKLGGTFPDQGSFLSSNVPKDLIHMSLNRGFRTQHRFQELVVYDFLSRYYQSLLVRDEKA